jgi:hypothetical protein
MWSWPTSTVVIEVAVRTVLDEAYLLIRQVPTLTKKECGRSAALWLAQGAVAVVGSAALVVDEPLQGFRFCGR